MFDESQCGSMAVAAFRFGADVLTRGVKGMRPLAVFITVSCLERYWFWSVCSYAQDVPGQSTEAKSNFFDPNLEKA